MAVAWSPVCASCFLEWEGPESPLTAEAEGEMALEGFKSVCEDGQGETMGNTAGEALTLLLAEGVLIVLE